MVPHWAFYKFLFILFWRVTIYFTLADKKERGMHICSTNLLLDVLLIHCTELIEWEFHLAVWIVKRLH
jgi:hypothetical protein